MKVETIRSTDKPEQLFCQTARGDYYDGYVGDTDYEKLMENVEYSEEDIEAVKKHINDNGAEWVETHMANGKMETAARTRAFIRKQLGRGHYGPAEHPQITFSVKSISRVTMAQITRHRHMTFDVQSQRYVDFSDKEAIVPKSLKDADHMTRETGAVDVENREEHERAYSRHVQEAFTRYEQMVEDGVPKEDARFILPVATPVNMTFSGNARTMMHVLNLRQKANAQFPIRQLAELITQELEEWMPYMAKWWRENGPLRISP